jgi:hypothetical protein
MNKSLLLVICDFLLLSVLALVKFDAPEEPDPVDQQEEQYSEGVNEDMTELFRLSLEEEAERRKALEENLAQRESELENRSEELQEREKDLNLTREELEQIRQEREALARERAALQEEYSATRSSLETTQTDLEEQKRQAAQLQEELRARQEALAAAEENLSSLEEQAAALAAEKDSLSTELQIADTERSMLRENLTAARAEVETARVERQRAEQRAENLATNVSQLAEQSGAMREEIRRSQPISLNEIFNRYQSNRLPVTFNARVDALIGSREETAQVDAILVRSGGRVFALFESGLTPLRLESLGRVLEASASFRLAGERFEVSEVSLLRADPRLMAVQLPENYVIRSGLVPFELTEDALRFPEVVLVSNAKRDYGETPFKLEPGASGYVTVPDSLLGRAIGGEFGASRGDYIFAKTGNLMGVMVNSQRGALLNSLEAFDQLPLGARFSQAKADQLEESFKNSAGNTRR